MRFSVIIPAYREEGVSKLVLRLLSERPPSGTNLEKIVVVECECKCKDVLDKIAKRRKKVIVVEEKSRRGKASSINTAMAKAGADIIIMESADTVPKKGLFTAILRPFEDARVGMVTGRPVPLNGKQSFIGYLSHTVWSLHHIVSSKSPKGGELVAFRRVFDRMPHSTVADESYVEFAVRKAGYKIIYAPEAVVYNRGPSSLSNFVKQRRRVFSGHMQIKDELGYEVSTMDVLKVMSATLEYATSGGVSSAKEALWMLAAIAIECWARLTGAFDFHVLKRVPYKWEATK